MTMNNKTCTEIPTELEGPSGNMNTHVGVSVFIISITALLLF